MIFYTNSDQNHIKFSKVQFYKIQPCVSHYIKCDI